MSTWRTQRIIPVLSEVKHVTDVRIESRLWQGTGHWRLKVNGEVCAVARTTQEGREWMLRTSHLVAHGIVDMARLDTPAADKALPEASAEGRYATDDATYVANKARRGTPSKCERIAECAICLTQEPQDTAIELGWVPMFFRNEEPVYRPVCSNCVERRLENPEFPNLSRPGRHAWTRPNHGGKE